MLLPRQGRGEGKRQITVLSQQGKEIKGKAFQWNDLKF